MVIEAGVVTGYVIAWAVRKARRAAGRVDAEVDAAIDASLDKLHELVAAKLGPDPVLAEVEEEAGGDAGQVDELTRQRVELALTAAARKDDAFGQAVMTLVAALRDAQRASGSQILASGNARIFTGVANAQASGSGMAFGQVAGDVMVDGPREMKDPS